MNELIKEYGNILVTVLVCVLVLAVIGYLCVYIAEYMVFFADCLMGG